MKIKGCCRKCRLLKDGVCKDNHEPVQKGSTIYVCGYQQKPYKEKAKDKSSEIKSLKKKLWTIVSKKVRERDNKCILCGGKFETKKLQAHHYIHTDASSPKYRYDLRNLVSLCYACHIHKIHSGSMAHIKELENKVIEEGIISKEELKRIAEDKEHITYTLEDYKDLIEKLK